MKRKPTKPPRRLHEDMLAKRNRAAPAQTRKTLSRHYAAKYRVR